MLSSNSALIIIQTQREIEEDNNKVRTINSLLFYRIMPILVNQ